MALLPDAPKPKAAIIVGTVTDVNDATIAGATVILQALAGKISRTLITNNTGFFQFNDLEPGTTYRISVNAKGFANWTSPPIILQPGQYAILKGSKLHVETRTTVNVVARPASPEEIATEQVKIAEQQRVFGIIPNFYVVYDHNAVPLTPKLKFKLATKVLFDPVTIIGVAMIAGFDQAGDTPNYGQGAQGYAKRFGASYASGATDIMIGGAILPSLLHQDPRYFYQGTGTKKSRALHAISSTVITRGDNGRRQPNYSTIGGDLASAAIETAYYPAADRGAGRVFTTTAINTGERALGNLVQEFILGKITRRGKKPQSSGH
ncbi:MAG TPA: carboxypeptidase-like regulatory domain-containing protein [Terriglobales bacterium]|nr:carboxypeptidase-like regulatory domain-containing protein [Terriglobales bacterium]